MSQITAPWDSETVKTLNYQQNVGFVHPYTCPKCGDNLVATQNGWVCTDNARGQPCDYTQNWAQEPPSIAQIDAMNPENLFAKKANK